MADESSRKRVALGSLKNLNLKEVEELSRNQLKEVLGGYVGGGTTQGRCILCVVDSGPNAGAKSCWFSKAETPNDLCSRVYQNSGDTGTGQVVDCYPGCRMN